MHTLRIATLDALKRAKEDSEQELLKYLKYASEASISPLPAIHVWQKYNQNISDIDREIEFFSKFSV